MVPFSVNPPATRRRALLPETVRSLLRATPPVKVPALLSSDSSSAAPSAKTTVPPLTVPRKCQDPVAALSVSVAPTLFNVPVRLMTPPARLIVPIPAVLNEPPRLIVLAELPSRCRVPLLLQALVSDRIPPATASNVPALVKVALKAAVRVWPPTFAEIRPLLTRLLVPEFSHCSPSDA